MPQEGEVFQTPPPTPRQQIDLEDNGIIHLNRILPIDPTYKDSDDRLPCGKPRPPHDFDQDLDGSSKRSHYHWRQVYQHYMRNHPTPSDLNGRDMILKQHNVLEVLKSAGSLPKRGGPIVQVLDSI